MSSEARVGWCEAQVREELPALQIAVTQVRLPPETAPTRPAPEGVRGRLAELSDRFNGAKAVNLRREQVTAAYRVFFRHIGLDPDLIRTPLEAAVLQRMLDGGFMSRSLLADVLLIAMLDTSVPVWALDAQTVSGGLGVRTAHEGEWAGDGQLVIADERRALSLLFLEPESSCMPTRNTRTLLLYAVQVAGVPWLAVEEALWISRAALEAGGKEGARAAG
jgi:DNA/RNA-binding domain of Phe-tRNA-synthetase-like protein